MTTSITSSTTQTIISAGGNPSALVIENGGIVSGIGKNKIINGNFAINQRGVSGTVVLAAGAYGHDRFKAGASGCTYTFATLENITTITISAGSLIQVIEGLNLFSGNVVLSWTGTAQGKIGAGAYGNSGVTGTAVGGTDLAVEFNTGTLSLVQLETGSYKSTFEHRPYGMELSLCQRYYEVLPDLSGSGSILATIAMGQATSTTTANCSLFFAPKRAIATITSTGTLRVSSVTGGFIAATAISFSSISRTSANTSITVASGLTAGNALSFGRNSSAIGIVKIDAEL